MFPEYDGDLFDAAEFGDFDWIKNNFDGPFDKVLKQKQLEFHDETGNTLLSICAYYAHIDIMIYLLDQKSQFEVADKANRIDEYKKVLSQLARHWRRHKHEPKSSIATQIKDVYHLVFRSLWEMGWKGDAPAYNDEVPIELIPDCFVKRWKKS